MGKAMSISSNLTLKYIFLQAFYWMAFATIWAFATVYLLDHGFKNTQVGIIMSIGSILSIIAQPLLATFADQSKKINLKSMIIFLDFILFLLAIYLWFIPSGLFTTGIIYIFIGSILLSVSSLTYSFAMEYINLDIMINFGLARGLGSMGYSIMAFFIGKATLNYSSSIILPIFASLILLMIITLFTFESASLYSKETAKVQDLKNVAIRNAQPKNIFSFFQKYKKFSLLLIGFTMLFISHNFINTYHINIIRDLGGNDADMGLSLSIAAAIELPAMIAFSYLLTKIRCSNLLKLSALFFIAKAIVTCIAPNIFVIYLSQILQAGAFALFTPASVYYANDIIDDANKVKGQALLGAATMGAGGTISNFIGGKILDSYNVTTMLVMGIIASVIGFVIILIYTENKVELGKEN